MPAEKSRVIRALAHRLRVHALTTESPGYADMMANAARELELRAGDIENISGYSHSSEPICLHYAARTSLSPPQV